MPPRTFLDDVKAGKLCLGTVITFSDPCITEALCNDVDFLWLDAEHNPLSLECIQAHMMAAKGGRATMFVRVPHNDPVLIKPILDLGCPGIVVPFVNNKADAELAVSATHYPPEGKRGFGPRRPSNYGRIGGPDYIKEANASVLTILQIESIDGVNNIEDILTVKGVSSILIGPNDLAGTMNLPGQSRHPDVLKAIEKVINACRAKNMPVGLGMGDNAEILAEYAHKGVQWLSFGADYLHLVRSIETLVAQIKEKVGPESKGGKLS